MFGSAAGLRDCQFTLKGLERINVNLTRAGIVLLESQRRQPSRGMWHTHRRAHTHSHTHTHTHTNTHTHSLSLSISLPLCHTHTHTCWLDLTTGCPGQLAGQDLVQVAWIPLAKPQLLTNKATRNILHMTVANKRQKELKSEGPIHGSSPPSLNHTPFPMFRIQLNPPLAGGWAPLENFLDLPLSESQIGAPPSTHTSTQHD